MDRERARRAGVEERKRQQSDRDATGEEVEEEEVEAEVVPLWDPDGPVPRAFGADQALLGIQGADIKDPDEMTTGTSIDVEEWFKTATPEQVEQVEQMSDDDWERMIAGGPGAPFAELYSTMTSNGWDAAGHDVRARLEQFRSDVLSLKNKVQRLPLEAGQALFPSPEQEEYLTRDEEREEERLEGVEGLKQELWDKAQDLRVDVIGEDGEISDGDKVLSHLDDATSAAIAFSIVGDAITELGSGDNWKHLRATASVAGNNLDYYLFGEDGGGSEELTNSIILMALAKFKIRISPQRARRMAEEWKDEGGTLPEEAYLADEAAPSKALGGEKEFEPGNVGNIGIDPMAVPPHSNATGAGDNVTALKTTTAKERASTAKADAVRASLGQDVRLHHNAKVADKALKEHAAEEAIILKSLGNTAQGNKERAWLQSRYDRAHMEAREGRVDWKTHKDRTDAIEADFDKLFGSLEERVLHNANDNGTAGHVAEVVVNTKLNNAVVSRGVIPYNVKRPAANDNVADGVTSTFAGEYDEALGYFEDGIGRLEARAGDTAETAEAIASLQEKMKEAHKQILLAGKRGDRDAAMKIIEDWNDELETLGITLGQ
jgi:hypothetical protein